jgi:hypothetical protein
VVLGVNLSEGTFQLADFALFSPNFYLGLFAFAGLAYLLIKIPMDKVKNSN